MIYVGNWLAFRCQSYFHFRNIVSSVLVVESSYVMVATVQSEWICNLQFASESPN